MSKQFGNEDFKLFAHDGRPNGFDDFFLVADVFDFVADELREDFFRFGMGQSKAVDDFRHRESHLKQLLGMLEQRAGEHQHPVGAVAGFLLLHLGGEHEHLGGGMFHLQLFEHRGRVVRHEDLLQVIDDHLVHAVGTEGGSRGFGQLHAGGDVSVDGLLEPRVMLGAFLQHGREARGFGYVHRHFWIFFYLIVYTESVSGINVQRLFIKITSSFFKL